MWSCARNVLSLSHTEFTVYPVYRNRLENLSQRLIASLLRKGTAQLYPAIRSFCIINKTS